MATRNLPFSKLLCTHLLLLVHVGVKKITTWNQPVLDFYQDEVG